MKDADVSSGGIPSLGKTENTLETEWSVESSDASRRAHIEAQAFGRSKCQPTYPGSDSGQSIPVSWRVEVMIFSLNVHFDNEME